MLFNIVTYHFIRRISDYDGSTRLIGGGEVYLMELCKLLLREGHNVVVIEPGNENKEFVFGDIKVREVKSLSSESIIRRYGFVRVIEEINFDLKWMSGLDKNADRIHLHSYRLAYPFGNESMTGTCHGI